jgi:hypothetical protein
MLQLLTSYFQAEKSESVLFVAVGAAALAASGWLLATSSTMRGMAAPFVAIGLIQLAVGGSVWRRTDRQVDGLRVRLAADPAGLKAAEVPRMEAVMRNFTVYKAVEVAVLLVGLALTVFLRRSELAYFTGVGCVAQGAVMLVFDLFAERRGQAYLDALRLL